jgi:hypothetical protein
MHQQDQIAHKFETGEAIVAKRRDGIVHIYYKPGTEITVTIQEKLHIILMELTGGVKSLVIFEAGEYCTVNKEARDHAITMEHRSPTKATVVYVTNLAHKIIAEFYYKFNKPMQPYRVVSDFQEGIDWLHKIEKEFALSEAER